MIYFSVKFTADFDPHKLTLDLLKLCIVVVFVSVEVEGNNSLEDMVDNFVTFFIAG